MRSIVAALFTLLAFCPAWGQSEPHLGYLYPAGGRQGSSIRIMAGGQRLKGVTGIHVTGGGVQAVKIRNVGKVKRVNRDQRRAVIQRLEDVKGTKWVKSFLGDVFKPGALEKELAAEIDEVKLPNAPILNDLAVLDDWELEILKHELISADRKKQVNEQLSELILIEVAVDGEAMPGDRELRLETPEGLTNPMRFQVGTLPEVCEHEPYEVGASPSPVVDPPVVLNGQIRPGDVDRFRFGARQGQSLVIETQARHLVPFLADAVPGWFQATVALYDAGGREVAFADDFRFNPDPVLFFEIEETGVYELEVRDSIYRGREDFVYRITVGEGPFIKTVFPMGGREGVESVASIQGWNLRRYHLGLDTEPGGGHIREAAFFLDQWLSNRVKYAVDALPEVDDSEPNGSMDEAQHVEAPCIVNGRIAQPGDVDVFRIDGRAGDELVAEVTARRVHSPLDSLLRLMDESGSVLEWNDDYLVKEGHLHRDMGEITHHADSYLRARLPRDGAYFVRLGDTQGSGSEAHGYRLRIGSPRPDFELRTTPSSINVRAGRSVPVCVHVLRKDGFDGDIELKLRGAPEGFELAGGLIPAGRDRIRVTLTAPRKPPADPLIVRLVGESQGIIRTAIPSDDVMQAFLYRHLVPAQDLVVAVTKSRSRWPLPEVVGGVPIRIRGGGKAKVRMKVPKWAKLDDVQLELNDPPEGLTLHDVTVESREVSFVLKADKSQVGLVDNLIVEAFTVPRSRSKNKKRVSLGVLPAIPFQVVKR